MHHGIFERGKCAFARLASQTVGTKRFVAKRFLCTPIYSSLGHIATELLNAVPPASRSNARSKLISSTAGHCAARPPVLPACWIRVGHAIGAVGEGFKDCPKSARIAATRASLANRRSTGTNDGFSTVVVSRATFAVADPSQPASHARRSGGGSCAERDADDRVIAPAVRPPEPAPRLRCQARKSAPSTSPSTSASP
jgi:hypothetical protein